jgi:hypothetical protein
MSAVILADCLVLSVDEFDRLTQGLAELDRLYDAVRHCEQLGLEALARVAAGVARTLVAELEAFLGGPENLDIAVFAIACGEVTR